MYTECYSICRMRRVVRETAHLCRDEIREKVSCVTVALALKDD